MSRTTSFWLGTAFLVGFLLVGLPYWQIPYPTLSLPNALMGPGLLVVGVAAAASRGFGRARLLAVILATGTAVPAAVLARVIVEAVRDPTSHNLWPFEVIIASVVGDPRAAMTVDAINPHRGSGAARA